MNPQPADPAEPPQKPPSEARWWRVTHTWYVQAPDRATAASAAQTEDPQWVSIVLVEIIRDGTTTYKLID